jgi:coenzyme F420-reducing hydrogenase alpha subunit
LRKLLYYGLIIRDHALHLYIFSSPDIFGKESVLDFDENDPKQHDLLHDMFAVKDVGNKLSIVTGGRAVHAPFVTVGGFTKLPTLEEIKEQKEKLLSIRDKVINLIELFGESDFELKYKVPVTYSALDSDDFSFIDGIIKTSDGREIDEKDIHKHLDAVIVPYSHARGFKFDGHYLLVGALPRVNMFKDKLHRKTQESVAKYLKIFPSENIFHNNLAQAIEILHAIDASIEIIDSLSTIEKEVPAKIEAKEAVGVGYIEAPRGGLYYKLEFDEKAIVKKGDIIVPTGQNQVIIEQGIYELVEDLIQKKTNKEKIINQVEAFIRAFDPCMSCASHFLKVRWL